MSMHYATISRSPRLQRALRALEAHPEGLTTRQLIAEADACACNSIAAELRANGFRITCRPEGRSQGGASVFRYILEKGGES